MGWSASTTASILVSQRSTKERVYQYRTDTGQTRYSDRSFTTTVEEYRNMTQAAAQSAASGMASDSTDGSGNRTQVTADVQRQNDADAYKVVKTTAYTSAWSAWSAWA